MLCCDCRQYIVIIITSILLGSCNYVEGSPSVAVLGGEAYMRWTVSTTTNGNRIVLDPANSTIIGFTNGKVQPIFVAPNVSYTSDISQGIMSFTLHGVTPINVGRYKYILQGNTEDGGQDLIIAESPNIKNITEISPPAVIGGNSMLNCTAVSTSIPANHNLAMLSEWKKNGMNIALGSKYSVSGTILAVNNLVRADSGDRFTCVAYEDSRKKSEESGRFTLNVFYGPDNVQITPTGDLTVDEEGPVNITCSAECNPVCKIYSWQNGTDHTLVGLKQSLVMPKVRREQAGFYICNVTNDEILLSATAQKKVSVNYGPDAPLLLSPSNTSYRVVENSTLPNITCMSLCLPSCDFQWTGPVTSSTGVISLGTVNRSEMGKYTCRGINPKTNIHANTDVTVFVIYGPDTPVIVPNITVYRLNESDFLSSIQCSADCFPNCTSHWYKENITVPGSPSNMLSLENVYRNESGNYTCRSQNTESRAIGEIALQLVIQYPPTVTINGRNGSHNDTGLMINCSAHGVPEQYTYKLTHHSLFSGIEIRQLNYMSISTGVILHQFTNPSFMDTGIYRCYVSNGIRNYIDGSLDQSIAITLEIKGAPYQTSSEFIFYAEKGHSGRLLVEFYNSLLDAQVMWYRLQNETLEYLQNSDKYTINISDTMVNVIFYSIDIQQPGLMASLEIRNITEEDFASYKVHVNNSIGKMYPVTLMLNPKGPPDIPQNVHIVQGSITTSSVGIGWVSGFHGGLNQTFVIEYRIQVNESWAKLPNEVLGGMSKNKDLNITVSGLDQETLYLFRMYSWNTYKRSEYSTVINATTFSEIVQDPVGKIGNEITIGSVTGAVVLLIIASALGVLLYRRTRIQKLNSDDDNLSRKLQKRQKPESGLRDNPVYDSSDPTLSPSSSSGAAGTEYAMVVKKKTVQIENASNICALVDKQKVKMPKGAAKGKHGKTSRGDIYENVSNVGSRPCMENLYANSKNIKTEPTGDNVYENPGAAACYGPVANKDGLLYAELMLNPPTTKNGMPVIRGIENRTEYAEIAYGKRGEPLPEKDEAKESNSGTNNYAYD